MPGVVPGLVGMLSLACSKLILPPFQIKVAFGQKIRYEIKVTFGEISLKLCQTNWNVTIYNVKVVANELPSQLGVYTCLTIGIWTRRR